MSLNVASKICVMNTEFSSSVTVICVNRFHCPCRLFWYQYQPTHSTHDKHTYTRIVCIVEETVAVRTHSTSEAVYWDWEPITQNTYTDKALQTHDSFNTITNTQVPHIYTLQPPQGETIIGFRAECEVSIDAHGSVLSIANTPP